MSGILSVRFNGRKGDFSRLVVGRFRGLAIRLFSLAAIMFLLPALMPVRAKAQSYDYWLPQSGDFSVSSNWSGGLPFQYACIDNGGTAIVNQTGAYVDGLFLGDSNGSGTVQLTGANVYFSPAYVGWNGTGTITQSAGAASIPFLDLSANNGVQGTYNLNGGTLSVNELENGSGAAFNFGGGVFQCTDPYPWNNISTNMPVNLTGGSATVDTGISGVVFSENVSGSGSLTKIGSGFLDLSGSVNYNGNLQVSSGTLNLTATGQITSSNQYVGDNGTAAFSQFSATNSASQLTLGYGASDSGTYTLTGGVCVAGTANVGLAGTGVFTQSNGSAQFTSLCLGGTSSTANGTYNLNGGTLSVAGLTQGSGSATFNFGNATLQALGNFTSNVPVTQSGTNMTVDTNGHSVTLDILFGYPEDFTKISEGTDHFIAPALNLPTFLSGVARSTSTPARDLLRFL